MNRIRGARSLTIWLVLLPLLGDAACSRPAGLTSTDGAPPADQHQIPFHDGSGAASSTPTAAASTVASDKGVKSEVDVPFHDPQNLPAGTLLIVRLKKSFGPDNPEATGTFDAVVDEAVMIEGSILVPRGATVVGRVESALTSKTKHSGYVRLTLDSMDIAGKDLRLQTSSLLARGNAPGNADLGLITLEKGRRFTFRLTEPVYVALQQALPGH